MKILLFFIAETLTTIDTQITFAAAFSFSTLFHWVHDSLSDMFFSLLVSSPRSLSTNTKAQSQNVLLSLWSPIHQDCQSCPLSTSPFASVHPDYKIAPQTACQNYLISCLLFPSSPPLSFCAFWTLQPAVDILSLSLPMCAGMIEFPLENFISNLATHLQLRFLAYIPL